MIAYRITTFETPEPRSYWIHCDRPEPAPLNHFDPGFESKAWAGVSPVEPGELADAVPPKETLTEGALGVAAPSGEAALVPEGLLP